MGLYTGSEAQLDLATVRYHALGAYAKSVYLVFRVVFFGGKTKMNFHNIKICFAASFLSAITLLGMPAEVYTQVMNLLVISFSL